MTEKIFCSFVNSEQNPAIIGISFTRMEKKWNNWLESWAKEPSGIFPISVTSSGLYMIFLWIFYYTCVHMHIGLRSVSSKMKFPICCRLVRRGKGGKRVYFSNRCFYKAINACIFCPPFSFCTCVPAGEFADKCICCKHSLFYQASCFFFFPQLPCGLYA